MSDRDLVGQISEVVGSTHVSGVVADRDAYGDLAPEVAVWPGSAREVAQVLKVCADAGAAVGVAGGLTRHPNRWCRPGRVGLTTRRMADLLEVDETSLVVHAQAGIRLVHLEEALRRQQLTLGCPLSGGPAATLGGALASPERAQRSPLYGRLADACIAVSLACTDGKVIHTRVVPRSATGPELTRVFVGSRGVLGVITAAVLRVHRVPESERPLLQRYPDLTHALTAARRIVAEGVRPAQLIVLNEAQARAEVGSPGFSMPALCVGLLAGPEALTAAQAELCGEIATAQEGTELPRKLADAWWDRQQAGYAIDEGSGPLWDPQACAVDLAHSALLRAVSGSSAAPAPEVRLRVDGIGLHGATLRQLPADGPPASVVRTLGLRAPDALDAPLLAEVRRRVDPAGILIGKPIE